MVKIRIIKKPTDDLLEAVNLLMGQMSLSATRPKMLTFSVLKSMLSQKNAYFLAASADSGPKRKVIGILTIYFIRIPAGLTCIAEDLIIDEPYRRWGVGRLLMERGIRLACAKKARHISLRTNPKRVDANKLYKALGFQQMETNFYRINLPRAKT